MSKEYIERGALIPTWIGLLNMIIVDASGNVYLNH